MNESLTAKRPCPTWQTELSNAFTRPSDLYNFLLLNPDQIVFSKTAGQQFALRVPLSFAQCMEKGNPNDPLLRQVMPISDELNNHPGFINDPVGDIDAAKSAGILHKYRGRVLVLTTGACAINCRYCFRRNFPYSEFQMSNRKQAETIAYISKQIDIREVILSGGDPLLLNDSRLADLLKQLNNIAHLKRIRIHSRLPIVLPSRITYQLLNTLSNLRQKLVLVMHCNHANEISAEVNNALSRLKNNQVHLLNQAVLLKGVNDGPVQLCQLSEKLFSCGVMPYYLHLLDKASGTSHFEVDEATAITIMNQVKAELPGYLVPRLVKEEAGKLSKTGIIA